MCEMLSCPLNNNIIHDKKKKKKKRIQYSLQNYNQLRIVDKIFILERNLLIFVSYRQLSKLTILHAKFLFITIIYHRHQR